MSQALSPPWFMPTDFMGTADILVRTAGVGWVDSGDDLVIDIVPAGPVANAWVQQRRGLPMDPQVNFTHTGYAASIGSIPTEKSGENYRLRQNGKDFKILRVRDWTGFYQIDLNEVTGG